MAVYDGIVLAGGKGRRMGTEIKPLLPVGGQPMLAAAVAALAGARRVTVVGPHGDLVEEPAGGGPVAALAAGLVRSTAPVVVVLASDLPFVTASVVARLVERAPAVALDANARPQLLLGAYRTEDLRRAIPKSAAGVAMRVVVSALAEPPELLDLGSDGGPPPWWDCDTPQELEAARRWS